MNPFSPIGFLSGIGPVFQKKLQNLGITTLQDLLFYFPFRYEDFSNISPIAQIKVNQKCCVAGKIIGLEQSRSWKKRMSIVEALIEDESGPARVVWFNQPFLARSLKKGDLLCLAGKVQAGKNGLFFSSPVFEKIYSLSELKHTGRLVPVYNEVAGISSRWLRYIIKPLLAETAGQMPEILPEEILKSNDFLPIGRALEQIHFPLSLAMAGKAKERLAFEELFLIELAVLQARLKVNQQSSPAIPVNVDLMQRFVGRLPFRLTDSQRKCVWQILKDIEKSAPMSRLLEGDVGSGKTVVAIMACLNVIKAGYQTVIMAPTEILAKQHFIEAAKLLQPFKIKIALLTGKEDQIISKKLGYHTARGFKPETIEISRSKILEKTLSGEIELLIGTHALIQGKVKFARPGLAVVDEQHRFGIGQRAKLASQRNNVRTGVGQSSDKPNSRCQTSVRLVSDTSLTPIPHLLSMTATPIPRTLALTVYGDLDLSLLDQMPKGRKQIITEVVASGQRNRVYGFVRKEVKKGRRVFVICPRIDPRPACEDPSRAKSPWGEAKAVKAEYEKLSREVFPDLKVGMMHGKLKVKEKEKIMADFKSGKIQILVSTSVVEVGVDVSDATIMLIEGADRFGLAQLHQFRGRVGRSKWQSYCFLFFDSPAQKTNQRLKAMMRAKNGFELAEMDLEIRGPGSLWGSKQWGLPDLAMANLKNLALVEKTRQAAKEILLADPLLKGHILLQNRVKTFEKKLHLE
ncbi:MAG: ATP-dependent DNA helicase RecG [Patescibacteria group bacterium]|nr:ATP-dependent DNA helicase RecG [Patescibacteria group bacterium]